MKVLGAVCLHLFPGLPTGLGSRCPQDSGPFLLSLPPHLPTKQAGITSLGLHINGPTPKSARGICWSADSSEKGSDLLDPEPSWQCSFPEYSGCPLWPWVCTRGQKSSWGIQMHSRDPPRKVGHTGMQGAGVASGENSTNKTWNLESFFKNSGKTLLQSYDRPWVSQNAWPHWIPISALWCRHC